MIKILVDKSLESLIRLHKYEMPEENMLFTPKFLASINLDVSQYKAVFEALIEVSC